MEPFCVHSQALLGIESPPVQVEVHVGNGLPAFNIVGLPTAAVRESRDRVRAAILQSGFDFPNRKLTVNLAPADLPKDSGRFDLPIAIGVLVATGQLASRHLDRRVMFGELSLSGEIRHVNGALPMALAMARRHEDGNQPSRAMIVPRANAAEVASVPGLEVFTAATLREVFDDLCGESPLPALNSADFPAPPTQHAGLGDFADVRGMQPVKRLLEIAAAGAHSVLLVGPPGAGKSMLAQRLPTILPPMDDAEALETGSITSLANRFNVNTWRQRPFRAPHHSASMAALVGGGQRLRPGEISLAHNGVLFLDELPEFGARTLDCLREPIETGRIALSRAARQLELPASFQLIAAMNPCPCGHYGSERCACTPDQVARYQRRLSGPLLDRLDLQQWIEPVPTAVLTGQVEDPAENSAQIARRVADARAVQWQRQAGTNASLSATQVSRHCALDNKGASILQRSAASLRWSARVFHRIQKIARTIADLDGATDIGAAHVAEAISMRRALGLVASGSVHADLQG